MLIIYDAQTTLYAYWECTQNLRQYCFEVAPSSSVKLYSSCCTRVDEELFGSSKKIGNILKYVRCDVLQKRLLSKDINVKVQVIRRTDQIKTTLGKTALQMDLKDNVGPDIQIFYEWVSKNYGGNSRTKTITREKYTKICNLLRGEDQQCNAKFRFWVRNKGFLLMKHDAETNEIKNDFQGDLYVSLHAKEENAPVNEYSIETFLRTNLPAISFYRKVAVVDEFHGIIKDAHVDAKGSHAGQKKTYRLVSDTYAFLPREVITYFLLNCETCKPRIQKYGPVPKKKSTAKTTSPSQQRTQQNGHHNKSKQQHVTNNQPIQEEHPTVHILDDSGCLTSAQIDVFNDDVRKGMPTLLCNRKRSFEHGREVNATTSVNVVSTSNDVEKTLKRRRVFSEHVKDEASSKNDEEMRRKRKIEEQFRTTNFEEERLLRERFERERFIRHQIEKEQVMKRRYGNNHSLEDYDVIPRYYTYPDYTPYKDDISSKYYREQKQQSPTHHIHKALDTRYKMEHAENYRQRQRYDNLRPHVMVIPSPYNFYRFNHPSNKQDTQRKQTNFYEHYSKRKLSVGSPGNDIQDTSSNDSHSPLHKDSPWTNSPETNFYIHRADVRPYFKSHYGSENSSPRSPELYHHSNSPSGPQHQSAFVAVKRTASPINGLFSSSPSYIESFKTTHHTIHTKEYLDYKTASSKEITGDIVEKFEDETVEVI